MTVQAAGIGNNLNQIARYFHGGGLASRGMLEELKSALRKFVNCGRKSFSLEVCIVAILKHIASKNANYGSAIDYLKYQHDEFHLVPVLDESGNMLLGRNFISMG